MCKPTQPLFSPFSGCQACGLYTVQKPLLAPPKASQVICVGLSAKQQTFVDEIPLDQRTNSGAVIHLLEQFCGFEFYKTNLVKCAPTHNNKLRYPAKNEIDCCIPFLKGEIEELRPKVVLMLGRQVAEGIAQYLGFATPAAYTCVGHHNVSYIAMPHPSYLWIYKRKELNDRLTDIRDFIAQAITDAGYPASV